MSFLDRAKQLIDQHDDKVDQGLDKAGEAAKGRFAGHEGHIDAIVDQAQQRTGAGDTTVPPPAAPPAEAPPAQPQGYGTSNPETDAAREGNYPDADAPQQGFRPDGTGHQVGYQAEGDYPPPGDTPQEAGHLPAAPAEQPHDQQEDTPFPPRQ